MENPYFPVFESADNKLKNKINTKLSDLLKKGVLLYDIVELLDAQEFLEHIETGKRQSDVAHFDVDGFIKKRTSENRKFSLPEEYIKIDETILPPSELEPKTGTGNGGFKEAGIIPRSTMLVEALTEMELKYSVVEGKNEPRMIRKLSYLIFAIPSMQKLVLVNDEEGNATYIIHKAQQEEWKDYMKMTKSELSEMPDDLVSSIYYPHKNKKGHQDKWKDKIKSLLINGYQGLNGSNEIEKIPKDWIAISILLKHLKTSWPTLKILIDEYRTIYPEWVKNRGSYIHISPELVEMLKEKNNESEPPEGWMSSFVLADKINSSPKLVTSWCEKYRLEHPDWFGMHKGRMGKFTEHYSPELVEIISDQYKKYKSIPEGWLNAKLLMKELNISESTLENITRIYKQEHQDWFEMHGANSKRREKYLHPDLIKLIRDKFKDNVPRPNDWLNLMAVMKLFKSEIVAVKKYLDSRRKDHPEWFKNYRDMSGKMREHYSPELVEMMKNDYALAPNDWITMASLIKIFTGNHRKIKDIIKPYRTSNPEWFSNYRISKGTTNEHYSPKLVEILKNELSKNKNVK